MRHKSVIFVVMPFLVIGTLGLSYSTDAIAVPPEHRGNCLDQGLDIYQCCWTETEKDDPEQIEIYMCQTCWIENGVVDCSPPRPDPNPSASPTTGESIVPGDIGVLEQPPASSPFDPSAPLQGGVLEQQEQQTPPTFAPGASPGVLEQLEQGEGFSPGFLQRQQEQPPADQGDAELAPPTSEGAQPTTPEEEQPVMPLCQEGLEFNEDLGFCVPTECPDGQELNEETGICVLEEPEAAEDQAQSEPGEEQQPAEEEDGSEDDSNN